MAGNAPITQFLGDPIAVFASTITTDADKASDCLAGVPTAGYSGVLFLQIMPYTTDAKDLTKMVIQYSSTGSASDAVDSNAAGWTNTDAAFPNATDTTYSSASRIALLDVHINSFQGALDDKNGKFFGATGATETSTDEYILLGIPYGHYLSPSTNAGSMVVCQSTDV